MTGRPEEWGDDATDGWQQELSLRRGPSAIGWVHPAEGQPRVAINKDGGGVAEAVTVGKGFPGPSLGFKGKSSDALRHEGPLEGSRGKE